MITTETTATTATFKTITLSYDYGCRLRTDDTITCWGNNLAGLVDAPEGTFKTITTGNGVHWCGCGLRTDDTIAYWDQSGGYAYGLILSGTTV